MIAQNKHWYVQRRGELAAQQFLLEIGATFISLEQGGGFPIDYRARFSKEDGTIVVVGVEVKATQTDIDGKFPMSSDQIQQLLKINIPILVIVVDVKEQYLCTFSTFEMQAGEPAKTVFYLIFQELQRY